MPYRPRADGRNSWCRAEDCDFGRSISITPRPSQGGDIPTLSYTAIPWPYVDNFPRVGWVAGLAVVAVAVTSLSAGTARHSGGCPWWPRVLPT
jgi:hypothetical protein